MIGEWHNKMEGLFPVEMREIKFFCSSIDTNTCRRADILLNNKRTCEIQHSNISNKEIENRFNDWDKFGKEIIWLVDGNTDDVICEKLSSNNYLIIFNKSWKYKSFIKKYEYILLEINNKVFKIELQKIKNKMIELKEYKDINSVIEVLKTNPENIWDFWEGKNVIKCNLTIHQQGAGNGKTYGIWKSIAENIDKKTFIIITKQHSAKNVIYEELTDQIKRKEYHIKNLIEKTEKNTIKHFVIKYIHKQTKRECIVIIGTIDSFCYNLSDTQENGINFFSGILKTIKKNGMSKVSEYGFFKYAGQILYLNKQTEIWIDEAQDLENEYLYAMTRLMLDTNSDINIVGDKLQTLENEDNFLTSIIIEGLPNIKINIMEYKNDNRRIKVKDMYNRINKIIKFEKYSLPEIKCDTKLKEINYQTIEIIDSPMIYANDSDDEKINKYVSEIIELVDNEVDLNNYYPENFMFIFPIMKGNIIASELQTKLQEYWIKKFKNMGSITNEYWEKHNHNEYTQYVYLHKHTEGSCINTKDSIKATRIMSIRTSKGDGREVVFILGTTENSLKCVSKNDISLIYESHLHVALTRAKNKIYFGLVNNNDDIHSRFGEQGYVEFFPKLKKTFRLEKIYDIIDKKKIIELLDTNININDYLIKNEKIKDSENKEQVDWGYHCIKYNLYFYKVILNIVNNKDINSDFKKSQLNTVLKKLSTINIIEKKPIFFYDFLNKHQYCKKKCCKNGLKEFPLCNLSDKPKYNEYLDIIKKRMIKIQKYIKNNNFKKLKVFDSVILIYMIQLYSSLKFADMSPADLYNITHFFQIDSSKEKELLETVNKVDNIIENNLIIKNNNINWNIFKHIKLEANNNDFNINKLQFNIIGNTETEIYHIILKSDLSKLNFWDTMIEVLMERFLIYNPNSNNDKDIQKFQGKKINTFILILNENRIINIDWVWDNELKEDIKNEIKKCMFLYYSDYHKDIYKYLIDIKDIKNKGKYWGNKCDNSTPFEYISKKMKNDDYPNYIIKFFDEMHEKWINNLKSEVKEIYENNNKFYQILNKKLEIACDSYLGLSKINEIDEDF
jgi:hypothetical protein